MSEQLKNVKDFGAIGDGVTDDWAANPIGGGSTHAKVRWNGSNWSVIGK